MESDFGSLLWLIYLYGGLKLALLAVLRRPPVSASQAFWFCWCFLVCGGVLLLDIAFMLEFVTACYPGRGLFLHELAVQCLQGSFTTIQKSVVSRGFVITIFWGTVLAYPMRKYRWSISVPA